MSCALLPDILAGYQCTGTLAIDGVELSTQAWSTVNLLPLWGRGPVRGSDIVLPQHPGEVPFPRRLAAFAVTLPMVITGCHDADGTPFVDAFLGLQANFDLLDNALAAQPANTRTAVLTMPDATTRTGAVHVLRLQLGDPDGALWRATLDLSIPGGMLA